MAARNNRSEKGSKHEMKKTVTTKWQLREEINTFRFQDNSWKEINLATAPKVTLESKVLKVVTWNVLFDTHQAELLFSEHRVKKMLQILRETDADIIGLEEVTKPLLKILLEQDWIREKYFISDVDGKTIHPYGQILLSKYQMRNMYLIQFSEFKRYILVEYPLPEFKLSVSLLHLTSDRSTNPVEKRAAQVKQVFNECQSYQHSIVMGDFNFKDDTEMDNIDTNSYHDIWLYLHNGDPGYTFDPDINTMAQVTSLSKKKRRLDRILLKSTYFQPTSIKMIGTDSFTIQDKGNDVVLFPSDHFGLYCEIAME